MRLHTFAALTLVACVAVKAGSPASAKPPGGYGRRTAGRSAVDLALNSELTARLKHGWKPDGVLPHSRSGIPALIFAAQNGYDRTLATLLKAGANPNLYFRGRRASLNGYRFPICFAARWGHARAIELLLQAGASISPKAPGSHRRLESSPLVYACNGEWLACARVLLAHGADAKQTQLGGGCSVLDAAAQSSSAAIVRLLVKHGAGVNSRTSKRFWTPLIYAVENNNVSTALALLKLGANPRLTAHFYHRGPKDAIDCVYPAGIGSHVKRLYRALISAAPDTLNPGPKSPLLAPIVCAASYRDPQCVRLLLSLGAKPNQGSSSEALVMAVYGGCVRTAATLLNHGAIMPHPRKPSGSLLQVALWFRSVAAVLTQPPYTAITSASLELP